MRQRPHEMATCLTTQKAQTATSAQHGTCLGVKGDEKEAAHNREDGEQQHPGRRKAAKDVSERERVGDDEENHRDQGDHHRRLAGVAEKGCAKVGKGRHVAAAQQEKHHVQTKRAL